MRSRRSVFLLGLTVLAVVVAFVLALRASPAADLATAEVTIGDVEQTVLANGKLMPKELVSVGAQVSGQVKRLYVTLGQSVRTGDPIADIDAEPQQLALQTAEAAVRVLLAQKAAREAAMVQAQLAYRRQEDMLAADATAHADYEAARAALEAVRGEVESLNAQLAQARTQVESARLNLDFTRIVAPIDGTIVAVVTKQGQTVNSFQSAPTIVMLARLDVMTVRAEISEADVEKVRPDQVVWFSTLGAPDRRHFARVQTIEPAPESIATDSAGSSAASASGTSSSTAIYYNALFDVPNPDGLLRPSMTVQVAVLLARERRAVVMPSAALGPRDAQGRYIVRVLDERGRPIERKILIGIADDSNVVVRSGLEPGQKVVLAEAVPVMPDAGMVGS